MTTKTRSRFHFAKLARSKRLQGLLGYMQKTYPEWRTTREIQKSTGCLNVATDLSELSHQGYKHDCHFRNRTENGNSIFVYRLKGKKA